MKQLAPLFASVLLLLIGDVRSLAADKPNVLFLFTDDQRPDTIAALGNSEIHTPTLDQLAREGFAFRRAYCMGAYSSAVCMPSRIQTLSGMHLIHARKRGLRQQMRQTAWPTVFKKAGYATLRTGKTGNHPVWLTELFDQDVDVKRNTTCAQQHADNAIRFIRENAGKTPFFVYVAFGGPHDPQPAPGEYVEMYNPGQLSLPGNFRELHPFDNGELASRDEGTLPWPRTVESIRQKLAHYYASVTYTDAQIKRIIDTLRATGQSENTLVVFSSDHGLAMGSWGLLGKQNLYEGSMQAPLVMTGPGVAQGGSDALVYLYDIYPTVCELSGVPVPAEIDGKSLAGIIQGRQERVRDALFTSYRSLQKSVRTDRWKLIRYPYSDHTQLFNLEQDPQEITDLAGDLAHQAKVEEMMALLKTEQQQYGDTDPLSVDEVRDIPITAELLQEWRTEATESKRANKQKKKKAQKKSPVS